MVSNKLDIELSGDAQRIIADARGFDEPSAEDRERVKARWLASIAIGAGISSFSDTARAASGGGWAFKGATLALAVAAGVAGLYFALPGENVPGENVPGENVPRGDSALPAVPSLAEVAAEPALPPAELAPTPLAVEVSPDPTPKGAELEARVEAARPATPAIEEERLSLDAPRVAGDSAVPQPIQVAARAPRRLVKADRLPVVQEKAPEEASAASGQLSEEIALLSRIRAGVREGEGARALHLLAEYRQRFERPILGMEAAALSVDALCQTGQRDAARAAADRFRNSWPESPLEQRVSSSCTQF